ncbi:WD40 repeat domain-containing protein [Nostoc linckia FACHB-104]|nr:WD40 repeat domain-containing protein [Nostoc linckia FACHB-104]
MIESLKNDGVYLETYFYDEDPRICFSSDEHNSPLKLHEIATKYRQHYLILVSDTEKLFSSISGELEPWVNQLLDWENRAILTPKPVKNYGYEEFVLAQDFFILPATPKGLQALSQKLKQRTATNYYPIEEIQLPLPESLRTRPLRWIERNSPPPEDIDKMLVSLEEYLGKDNFYWLGACAIFPQLHWNITVYLGNTFKTEDGHSLLELASLTKLARLPWFRFGYIPDWLRIRLISSLTHEQEHQIRTALRDLLIKAVHDSVGGLQLEVATQSYSFSSKLVNPILRILSKQASEDSLLKDYIFLGFMTRSPVLAISVPKEFSRLLQRQKRYNSSKKTPLPNYRRHFLKWVAIRGVVLATVVVVLETLPLYDLNNSLRRLIENITGFVVTALLPQELKTLLGHDNSVLSVSFSPDGKTLASGSADNTIKLWNLDTGKGIRTLNGHSDYVYSVSFSPDGKTLASGSRDKTIKLWNLETGKEIRTLNGHSDYVLSVSFSPDGKTLASGSDDNTIKLWNLNTGQEIRTLKGHDGSVLSVSFSPNGKTLASGSSDKTIKLWNLETGKEIRFSYTPRQFSFYLRTDNNIDINRQG